MRVCATMLAACRSRELRRDLEGRARLSARVVSGLEDDPEPGIVRHHPVVGGFGLLERIRLDGWQYLTERTELQGVLPVFRVAGGPLLVGRVVCGGLRYGYAAGTTSGGVPTLEVVLLKFIQ